MSESNTRSENSGTERAGWTLQPHPHELQKAVTTDHVAVFGGEDTQMEVSGESEFDDLNIDWSKIELDADDVEAILNGERYVERCEDLAGRRYKIYVSGGEKHPKGTPIHTEGQ